MIEQPVAAAALRRAGQRGDVAGDRGEFGTSAGAGGVGGVARGDPRSFVAIRLCQRCPRGLRRLCRGAAPDLRSVTLGRQRRDIAERGDCSGHRIGVAGGATDTRLRRRQCGGGDARVCGFARLTAQRLCQRDLGIACRAFGFGKHGIEPGCVARRSGDPGIEHFDLVRQPRQRLGGIACQRTFARAIVGDPMQRGGQFRAAAHDDVTFGGERRQPVPRLARSVARIECGGARARHHPGGAVLIDGGGAFGLGSGSDLRLGRPGLGLGGIGGGDRLAPAGEDHPRLGDADLPRNQAIAFGGARLSLQCRGARVLIGDHFVQPRQIGLGRAQFLFGIAATDVEARDSRRFLQHRAAVGGLGGDYRADPSLADECGRMRAGGGVGEE